MWYAYDTLQAAPVRRRLARRAVVRPGQAQRRGSSAQVFFLRAGLRLLQLAHRLLAGAEQCKVEFLVVRRNDPPSGPLAGPDEG